MKTANHATLVASHHSKAFNILNSVVWYGVLTAAHGIGKATLDPHLFDR